MFKLVFSSILLFVAFFPCSEEAWAFKPGIHEDLTETALESMGFDTDSADEVGDSNYYTDLDEPHVDAAHADNNELGAASTRIKTKREDIGEALSACKRRDALDALGEALHTVQDVYSHSNAVDNGITISDILNMEWNGAHCDAANGFAPGGLVTGYFNLGEFFFPCALLYLPLHPIDYLECVEEHNECTGMPSHMCCHRELNKDNASQPNGANHAEARSQAIAATRNYLDLVYTYIDENFSVANATQFKKMLQKKQRTTFFVIDDTGSMSDDIAQVKADVNRYLDELIAADEAPTLGLVTFKDSVTNHGLTCDIDNLRSKINSLSASGGGDCPEASNSALLKAISSFPIGRGDIQLKGGRILLATDASAGDRYLGPQVRSSALRTGIAIDSILTGDCVSSRALSVSSRALSDLGGVSENDVTVQKNNTQRSTRSIRADEGDPLTSPSARVQLQALADQTGGVIFIVARDEVEDVVPILLELGAPDTEAFFSQRISLSSSEPMTVDVPVDNTLSSVVTFMVTGENIGSLPSMILKRPDGTDVNATDHGITLMQLSSVISYRVENPQRGNWRIELAGEGNYLVRAFGTTELRLNGLRLLQRTDQPPRPEVDLIPIEGDIVAGTEIVVEMRFTTNPGSVSMALQRSDGSVILTPEITPIDGVRRFQATFIAPSEPFIIKLTGQTTEDSTFRREFPVIVTPQTVGISATPTDATAAANSTASFEVTVNNASENPATYAVTGISSLGWTVNSPPEFVVQPGESQTVTIEVEVPADAAQGTTTDITIFVQDVNTSPVRNSTLVFLTVSDSQASTPQFTSSTVEVAENAGTVTLTVRRVGGTNGELTVNYATTSGTATDGSDYVGTTGTLTWADGDSSDKTLTVTITDDGLSEGNETFTVILTDPVSGESLDSATVTISDNDTTLVTLVDFSAIALENSIEIVWITNTEFDSIGFHLWRATGDGWKYGDYSTITRLTDQLIPAEGNSGAGASYSYIDSDVEPGVTYYYGLEDRNGVGQPTYYLDDIDSATAK